MSDKGGTVKKLMYINRKAPYGTIYALESLEVVLIGAAFDQNISLAFIDDGVYQLAKGQNTEALGVKNFSPTYKALGDYDINKIYVEKESLQARGLNQDDLMALTYEDEDDDWAEKNSIHIVSTKEMSDILEQQDVVFSF
ncbi:MAG: sulfurtransferase complex subunit TusC [Gammaproteobacteria bacterium]|nr:sulfurtransferase complex subunit TusC [Gammaproteobacteria bacterium]